LFVVLVIVNIFVYKELETFVAYLSAWSQIVTIKFKETYKRKWDAKITNKI
jgi:hypothetical protein